MVHEIAIGVALGALGSGAHLGLTWWRARQITSGRTPLAWLTFPLGLAAVGAAIYGAAQVGPAAAWAFVLGLFATRLIVLHRLRGADRRTPWIRG